MTTYKETTIFGNAIEKIATTYLSVGSAFTYISQRCFTLSDDESTRVRQSIACIGEPESDDIAALCIAIAQEKCDDK